MPTLLICPVCDKKFSVSDVSKAGGRKCLRCSTELLVDGVAKIVDEPPSAFDYSGLSLAPKISLEPVDLPKQIAHFAIRAILGAGAFGTVYRATDLKLHREVALKVPHPHLVEKAKSRFLREAIAGARLQHPHIVPVFETGEVGTLVWIASAYIKGKTLDKILDTKPNGLVWPVNVVRHLAEALMVAQNARIVHRDVKPSNILIDKMAEPYLMDFGLASLKDIASSLTQEGAAIGTPAYMSPEQAAGKKLDNAFASDQYSLGVVFYELLCHELPFHGPPGFVINCHRDPKAIPDSPRQRNPEVPPELEVICMKMMEKNPADRYPDCQAVADDLQRWRDGKPVKAIPVVQPIPTVVLAKPDKPAAKSPAPAGRTAEPKTMKRPVPKRVEVQTEEEEEETPTRRGYGCAAFATIAIALIAASAIIYWVWQQHRPLDEELRHDWDDYRRTAMTTGSAPFFLERGPNRIDVWKQAAERGNAQGMVLYGKCVQDGMGTAQNDLEAVRWFRKASEKGEPLGIVNLGRCYYMKLGVAEDRVEAFNLYRKAAEMGDPLATLFVGDCYEFGQGVKEDAVEAIRWYRKAMDLKTPRAANNLGECYLYGKGVPKDATQAISWFQKGADLGDSFAMVNLAIAHEHGTGVVKDKKESLNWYHKAARAHNVEALLVLSKRMYDKEDNTIESDADALNMLQKAEQIDAVTGKRFKYEILEYQIRARKGLAEDDLKATRYAKAREHLSIALTACETLNKERPGRFYFMQDLGRLWFVRGNVDRAEGRFADAADSYRKSMEIDGPVMMTQATKAMAELLENGTGVAKDPIKAAEYRAITDKQKIRRFTVPCKIGNVDNFPVHVYVYEIFPWRHPLETQYRYFKEERGFDLPKEVMDSFERLHKIARENKVSFTELCVNALGDKKGVKK